MKHRPRALAGFSLVELLIAMTIFSLLLGNVLMVTNAGKQAAESGVFNMSLTDELNLTVDRISLAIMAASADDVDEAGAEPIASTKVVFSSKIGMNDGTVVRGPVEEIEWLPTTPEDGRIVWREQPRSAAAREVNWSNSVPHVGKDEIDSNAIDDDGNGVQDEKGLGFTKTYGSRVDIYVTVERVNGDGKRVPNSTRHHVTCRN